MSLRKSLLYCWGRIEFVGKRHAVALFTLLLSLHLFNFVSPTPIIANEAKGDLKECSNSPPAGICDESYRISIKMSSYVWWLSRTSTSG
jgi:hypothetical protein